MCKADLLYRHYMYMCAHANTAAAVQCIITAALHNVALVIRIYMYAETSALRVDLPAHVHKLVKEEDEKNM